MQFLLVITSVCFNPVYQSDPDGALAIFELWEQHWHTLGVDAKPFMRACRMRVLAMNGQPKEALLAGGQDTVPDDLASEWLAAPARTFESLLRVQRGEFQAAISRAETTRQLIMLHDISPTLSGDLEGFALFLAHWARGTAISAKHAIEEMLSSTRADLVSVQTHSGLVDLALTLFALQEARWYEAAELADRLILALHTNDPFGLEALAYAATALAHAALGEEERAHQSLRLSESRQSGVSRVLNGFVGTLALQARHWLRDPDLVPCAQQLALWARQEELPLIELKALDVVAHETATPDLDLLNRATELAGKVDSPIGDAILAHISMLTNMRMPGTADPEERLLSELGIWQPLPPVQHLTGREREIALYTALGYSSKLVAERLHLSARTIETHLTHVYSKVGVNNREELRLWFSHRRDAHT